MTSRAIDLGRKAAIYAAAAVAEYWMLDPECRRLVVHRDPREERYETADAMTDADVVSAACLPLTVVLAELLPPRS